MAFKQALNDWLSIVIKIVVIGVVIIGIIYLCISGVFNWKLNQLKTPDPPDIVAEYDEVTLTATNQKYYTENCDLIRSVPYEVYKLNGYYELVKNKWVFRDIEIMIDEEYYGDILIHRR